MEILSFKVASGGGIPPTPVQSRVKGRVHSKKKKVKKFLNRGGGSGQTFLIFLTFLFLFFHVLIHANLQRNFFFHRGGYPLLTTKTWKIFIILTQFVEFFKFFQGIFFFCRKYLSSHQRKKINFGLS